MYGVHVALHISVFLFFWAVSDFLYNVYQPVGNVARYGLLTSLVVYAAFSISPLIFISSPYHTALTPPLRGCGALVFFTFRILLRFIPRFREPSCSWAPYFEGIRFHRTHFLVDQANKPQKGLDEVAMKWLLTENDLSDASMDTFLKTLPDYIHSPFTEQERLQEQLMAKYIIERIKEHFLTCATSHGLPEDACIARVSACVNSLRLIFKPADKEPDYLGNLRENYIQGIIKDLNEQCEHKDSRIALRASCVRGLAFQGLLRHLTPSDSDQQKIPDQTLPPHLLPSDSDQQKKPDPTFPPYLSPLYRFVLENSERPWLTNDHPPSAESLSSPLSGGESENKWTVLLNDGPLVNLTLVAEAVILHHRDQPQDLSLCWKTLNALMKEFGITRLKFSTSALMRFKEVLRKARECAQSEHLVIPLLEVLDIVDRGRRLGKVFLNHPEHFGKAEVLFGKEQLRNSDLMEAVASCLPGYIVSTSKEKRRKFMESMVCDDDLWNCLQVHLWNATQLESRVHDKLRIFEACCTVIDAMFLALEDSTRVDWRSPEFGSLSQHFELFLTTCFKGTFIGTATGFRVALIKLRFCDALLTQFCEEVHQERSVSLQSQWDVACLARVFYTLEVGGEEDVAFWKSFTNGDVEPRFIQKAPEMLDATIRDGPLLNFCKLGHLAVATVPFVGSGLETAEIGKAQELQEKMLKSPLTRASDRAWRKLNELELEVRNANTKRSDDEKDMLDRLLGLIKRAKAPLSAQQLRVNPSPDERGAQTPPPHYPSKDDPSTPDSASPQPEIHNRMTSRVLNQVDIIPFATSLVPPRSAFTRRQPSRRRTAPPNSTMARDRLGLMADAGSRSSTLVGSLSSQSTSHTGLDSISPDILMFPLPENLGSIDDQSNATPTIVEDRMVGNRSFLAD